MRIGLNSAAIGLAALLTAGGAEARDVAAFWRSTLARLAAEPLDAVGKELRESLPNKTYSVEYRSLGGVRVRARLALPIQGGQPDHLLPAIVTAPGYGSAQQGIMLAECQRGYAIPQVSPRSQGPSAELWKIDSGEKLTWNLSKPEGAYYQLAYADVIRGVDYLAARAGIDPNRIGIAGTSKGGGIALAMASLAPLSLAPSLRAPALVSSGGRDTICPAATIRAVFDRFPSTKPLLHEPDLPHTTPALFYCLSWRWLDQYLRP
ncbi:MAG: hypothetical protein IANPNBLG_03410 [Bryobacteraceae bacterium]|nr:hypothetical protein [Bryobacteraceae bacterium]